MKNSHCSFCGVSNCKQCLRKTRPFAKATTPESAVSAVSKASKASSKSQPQALRGPVCKLCDRKFFIRRMLKGSVDKIKQKNKLIKKTLAIQEALKEEIKDLTRTHADKVFTVKKQAETLKGLVQKVKIDMSEL